MLVRSIHVIRAPLSASGVQHCVAGRSARALVQLQCSALPAKPKVLVQFSTPLNTLETRPDCYIVYKEWCDEVEDDLRTVCTGQLGLGLPETRRILHAAREHYAVIGIFLNPARVLARVRSWRPLENQLTASGKNSIPLAAELFANQPTLISQTTLSLQKKVQHLKQLLDEECDTEKLSFSIRRRPHLLQRSTTALSAVFKTLSDTLGHDSAAKTVLRYPELFSRSPETICNSFSALKDLVGERVAVRMVVSNPSVLVRKDMPARFVRVSTALDLPPEHASTVIRALPTLLNIPPVTLKRRLRMLSHGLLPWYTTHASLKPSVLGRLLTSPDARLMRLNYLAFLYGFVTPHHITTNGKSSDETLIEGADSVPIQPGTSSPGVDEPASTTSLRVHPNKNTSPAHYNSLTEENGRKTKKSGGAAVGAGLHNGVGSPVTHEGKFLKAPMSFVIMPEEEFLSKYPRFPRWLRRKNRSLSVLSVRTL